MQHIASNHNVIRAITKPLADGIGGHVECRVCHEASPVLELCLGFFKETRRDVRVGVVPEPRRRSCFASAQTLQNRQGGTTCSGTNLKDVEFRVLMCHLVNADRGICISLFQSVKVTVVSIDSVILQQQSQGVYLAPENLGKQLSHFECQLACTIDGSVLFKNVKGQRSLDARVFASVLGPAIEFLMVGLETRDLFFCHRLDHLCEIVLCHRFESVHSFKALDRVSLWAREL